MPHPYSHHEQRALSREEISRMPKQWITKYGVAQARRPGSALFPPTLVLHACQITLERDGLHFISQSEEGTIPLVFSRAEVVSLVDWLKGESAWFGNDLD